MYYNKMNYKKPVTIEYCRSHAYTERIPNYKVWIIDASDHIQKETIFYSEIHERALYRFIDQLKGEFNIINL